MNLKPRPKSLRQLLVRALLRSVLVPAMLGLGFVASSQLVAAGVVPQIGVTAPVPQPAPLVTVDPVQTMVEDHGCWTGEAPADMEGVFPGHVVVTRDGELVYGGRKLAGQALSQIFEGEDHGLDVHAFCR